MRVRFSAIARQPTARKRSRTRSAPTARSPSRQTRVRRGRVSGISRFACRSGPVGTLTPGCTARSADVGAVRLQKGGQLLRKGKVDVFLNRLELAYIRDSQLRAGE